MAYTSSFHPSFDQILALHNDPEFRTPFEWFKCRFMYKSWMECTYDKHLKKSIFLHDFWAKSDGVFAEMQIISYIFIILKHIEIDLQFGKLLMLIVWL